MVDPKNASKDIRTYAKRHPECISGICQAIATLTDLWRKFNPLMLDDLINGMERARVSLGDIEN